MKRLRYGPLGLLGLVLGVWACTADPDLELGSEADPTGGSTGTGGATPAMGGAGGGDDAETGGANAATGGVIGACEGVAYVPGDGGEGGACAGVGLEIEAIPADLVIMMDRSQSMGYPEADTGLRRIDALREAVQTFAASERATEIRAGLGFFNASGGRDDVLDCSTDSYATPAVPIGFLSDVGDDMAAAIEAIDPGGLTPVREALDGAIEYARIWQQNNPDRMTVVAMVGDGYPTQCSVDPGDVTDTAAAGLAGDPSIRSYFIGVGAAQRFNLDNYALAGGTTEAYLTAEGNVAEDFVTTLLNITTGEIACNFRLPQPAPDRGPLDTDKVQMVYYPAAGEPQEIPYAGSAANCGNGNGGWYYDNANEPTRIIVCPCTCSLFGAGRVETRIGCDPHVIT